MMGELRQAMASFHGWSGIVAGWVLYMMFVTGSPAVFKDEITTWMTPEAVVTVRSPELLDRAKARLQAAAPNAASWTVTLPDARDPVTRLSWRSSEEGRAEREILGAGNAPAPRETRGGDFFYRLHYRFDQPGRSAWGYSAAMAIVMLSIVVSGIITHKRFLRDFFTFRPSVHRQRAWLDAHLVLGVLLLPFHLVITYTGLIPIVSTVMPFGMLANYGSGEPIVRQFSDPAIARKAFAEERSGRPYPERAAVPLPVPDLDPFVTRAEERWGSGSVSTVTVRLPGDRNATVELARSPSGVVSHRRERLVYHVLDGSEIASERKAQPAADTQAFLYGLHMARFADPLLRWLYFIAGLGSAALIATGLLLWTVKRNTGHHAPSLLDRFIARANPGVIVGLPIAMVGFFLANRLLPLEIAARPLAEVRSFFLIWIAALLIALVIGRRRAWFALTGALAVAAISVPFVNAATTNKGAFPMIMQGNWLVASVDLTMMLTGIGAAAIAWRLRPKSGSQP